MKRSLMILVVLMSFGINSYAGPVDDIQCTLKEYAATNCVEIVNKGNYSIEVTLELKNAGGDWYRVTRRIGVGKENIDYVCNGYIKNYRVISAKYVK